MPGIVGGVPYLVVEYLQGRSLQDELHAAPTAIGIGHAARWIAQVCHALAQAHSRGIIHRDVKPGNIVLVRDSAGVATVRLVDFGIAKVLWTDSTVPLGVTQEAALGNVPLRVELRGSGKGHVYPVFAYRATPLLSSQGGRRVAMRAAMSA